eukprot:EG_transcript_8071
MICYDGIGRGRLQKHTHFPLQHSHTLPPKDKSEHQTPEAQQRCKLMVGWMSSETNRLLWLSTKHSTRGAPGAARRIGLPGGCRPAGGRAAGPHCKAGAPPPPATAAPVGAENGGAVWSWPAREIPYLCGPQVWSGMVPKKA